MVSVLSALLCQATPVWAETTSAWSGFGTLGAVHSNNREADFIGSIVQPVGSGKSQATSYGVDSKLGGQVAVKFDSGVSGIVQVVVDHRYDHTYRPEIEWANLKYDLGKNAYVRAGRVVAPVFMYSEQRNVGYSLTPAREPVDVYSLNPITHLDGLDVGVRHEMGGGVLSAQVTGGRHKLRINPVPVIELSGSAAMFNSTYETGASTFRFGYGKYKLQVRVLDPTSGFMDMYEDSVKVYGSATGYGADVANLRLHDVRVDIWGLGYAYDPGTWLLQTEYVSRKSPGNFVQDAVAGYVLGGYRIGKLTPYASYSRLKSKESPLRPVPAAFMAADPLNPFLIPAIESQFQSYNEQSTLAFGVRYDFYRNLALKAQFERVRKPGTPTPNMGTFNLGTPVFAANNQQVNLLTLNLDFVF
jgi:hypothetical protein